MKRTLLLCFAASLLVPAGLRAEEKTEADKMMAEHQHDKPTASPAAVALPAQPVVGEEVTYGEIGGKPLKGYLAHPKAAAKGPRPALLVIHEWWGLNDNIRAMTRRLAGEGYTALAVDLYDGQVAADPDKAKELMGQVLNNTSAASAILKAAHAHLKQAGASKIGVIGWCFGGGWSLQTTLLVPEGIDATVIYYGHLETDKAKLATIKSPILGFFGGLDQSIPADSIHAFEKTLTDLGKKVEVHIYPDAKHAFANPSGGSYNAAAAEDSWKRTKAFFKKYL